MFEPPCCPSQSCPMHQAPEGRFFQRNGSYHALCRSAKVPRFRCKVCGKRFSRQTFRIDYRDKKPYLTAEIAVRLTSGTGLRRSARALGVSRSTVERKFHKLGVHLRLLQENTISDFGERGVELVLDELETFETCRLTRPVTVAALVERAGGIALRGGILPDDYDQLLSRARGALDEGAEALGDEGYHLEVEADKVTLTTRRAGLTAEHGVQWESKGDGE